MLEKEKDQTQMAEAKETSVSLSEYAEIVKENAELKSKISELNAKNEALTKNILSIVRPVSDCINNELEMFKNTAAVSSLDLLLKRTNAEPSDVATAIVEGKFKADFQTYCQTDYETFWNVICVVVKYKIDERDLRDAANERRANGNRK